MKLNELAIDGIGNIRNFLLGPLGDGLNFVYGENRSGKSELRHTMRAILWGTDPKDTPPMVETGLSHLRVRQAGTHFQLERHTALPIVGSSPTDLKIELLDTLSGQTTLTPGALEQTLRRIAPPVFDHIYSFSFRDSERNSYGLADVLTNQFDVPYGIEAAGVDTGYDAWKRESDARQQQLASLQRRLSEKMAERETVRAKIESDRLARQSQLTEIEQQLYAISDQINQHNNQLREEQLESVEREMAKLKATIDQAIQNVTYVPQVETLVGVDPVAVLYQRLDEIDNQIGRWRRVQSDIQAQRLKLKDEMAIWSDLSLESDEHPYHNARKILTALESKLDQAEHQTDHYDATGNRVVSAGAIHALCREMREDLYRLCDELSHQYKHIRHKAATAELKQLRRCYHEMGENIERLIQRRDGIIQEIRQLDPAGADAIVRSETGFCQCAMHEGYLEARKRYVATPLATPQQEIKHRIIQPDLSEQRRQLEILGQQRNELIKAIANSHAELQSLRDRHAELVRQQDALRNATTPVNLTTQIREIEQEIGILHQQIADLQRLIESDRHRIRIAPDPILVRASELLRQLSLGELDWVFLGESNRRPELLTQDRSGNVRPLATLPADLQDQVYFATAVAAKESLERQGIEFPMMIDDAFSRITGERVQPTLDCMVALAQQGHQLILLTQHRYLVDRVPGTPFFELPPTRPETSPIVLPERSVPHPPLPTRRTASIDLPRYDRGDLDTHFIPANDVYSTPSNYPLSKYPATDPEPEYRERSAYTVAHPAAYAPEYTPIETRSSRGATPISVDTVGDRVGYIATVDDATLIDQLGLFDANHLGSLADARIETVGQLLDLDPENLPIILVQHGITPEQFDRWQAQVWLLYHVPGLRPIDAKILVACGVTDPEHLTTSHSQQLYERIHRFLASSEGQRYAVDRLSLSVDRINGWYRALNDGRHASRRRSHRRGSRASSYRPFLSRKTEFERDPAYYSQSSNGRNGRSHSGRTGERMDNRDHATYQRPRRSTGTPREPMVARPPRMRTPERSSASVGPRSNRPTESNRPARPTERKTESKTSRSPSKTGSKLRFYLDLNDHIEAAPSIGPKTAERFEKIGVTTVADFLKRTAESMAEQLNYKRITADLIRAWQHQARLVCRIPNLRGHDAQLLVACDFTEPEEVATMQPQQLLDTIGPFAETKEGMKIIRNGKKPDLAEITDWITWAGHNRSLQAA